jgi:glyoxylase-like metal-dependent hydrolase (beta-lactamase superfamily II)
MNKRPGHPVLLMMIKSLLWLFAGSQADAQTANQEKEITVRSVVAGGVVYMMYCENGFGGGNVAASVGPDGILLVDNMFKDITPKLLDALKKISQAGVRMVVNSHFHADHIEGNTVLSHTAVIVAHENMVKRFNNNRPAWVSSSTFPQLVFSDSLTVHFNGEDIRIFHLPNGHTDNDVFVYFTKSGVMHLGDTYFNEMFPAVYKEGGGDIMQMITNLEKILVMVPDNVKFIPGHGSLATKSDFRNYVIMLRETTFIISAAIKSGMTLEQALQKKLIAKYDALGNGGAQTTDEFTEMLWGLLK